MLRAVDMQQVLLQSTTVGKMQQQGAHGAEVEQAKLAQQQLLKEEKQQRDIQEISQTEHPLLDNNAHQREGQSFKHPPHDASVDSADDEPRPEKNKLRRRPGGVFIDIKA
ncbi:MAG: hypothetical protein DRH04_05265 [Deltaproteobacteria bacterium]|nr:MAG: hypothetical protein DRH04_05265 [Deltaproteobacteria bacterium]